MPIPSSLWQPDNLYASRAGRVFIDAGGLRFSDALDGSWTPVRAEGSQAPDAVLHDADGGWMVAKFRNQIAFESHDEGESWSLLTLDGVSTGALFRSLAVASSSLYVGAGDGLFRRDAAGGDWTQIGYSAAFRAMPDGTLFTGRLRYRPTKDQWQDLRRAETHATDNTEPTLLTDQGVLFFRQAAAVVASPNLGEDWNLAWQQRVADLSANASGLLAGVVEDAGVFVYRDGGWAHVGPATSGVFKEVAVLPDGRIVVLWTPSGGRSQLSVTTAPVSGTPYPTKSYPPTCHDGLLSSGELEVDCGGDCSECATWEVVRFTPGGYTGRLAAPNGTLLVWQNALDAPLWRSGDEGRSWQQAMGVKEVISAATGLDGKIYALGREIAESRLYVSTDDGSNFQPIASVPRLDGNVIEMPSGALIVERDGSGVRSLDGGQSWQEIDVGNLAGTMFGLDAGALFYSTGDSLLRSGDDGASWVDLAVPWTNGIVTKVSGTVLQANTFPGIYLSNDDAETWRRVELPEPDGDSAVIRVTAHGKYVYIGTGVFISDDGVSGWRPARDRGRYQMRILNSLADGRIVGGGLAASDDFFLRISTDPDRW